ncbi:Mef2 protein [Saccharomycopsis crataegensis]|uniref:Ribosome-releasing factor 2, mitochondrial n=1 Tax=Saccharomycopsis crataegensis TaxID=43959 RepID=A0AAV5QJK9_9ASCO|nr:Mef2 protein [Saccharomycopsis crataegensis]
MSFLTHLRPKWTGISKASYTFCRSYATAPKSSNESTINQVSISKIRNVGIIAHIDAGKTTTTERMLFYSGSIKQIGDVDHGDTITDYLPAERDRGITIQSAAVTIPWNQHKINIIDTPGHADFTFEVIRSLRVLDGAVTILDSVAGVEAQTEKVWKQAKALELPTIIYVNKMDRMGSGFSRTCKEIISKLRTKIVLTNIPYFVENEVTREQIFSGVVDVLNKKLLIWDPAKEEDGSKIKVINLEEEDAQIKYSKSYEELCSARESAIETLCEFDDMLVDAFLENDEDYMKVSTKDIKKALRAATINNDVSPVLCGASFKNIGVQPLLDAVIDYLPTPNEAVLPEVTSNSKTVKRKKFQKGEAKIDDIPAKFDTVSGLIVNNNPRLTVGLAFKVITDNRKIPMIFVRVYSGKLQNGSTILNTRTGKKFRITNLFLINGNNTHKIDKLTSGNIGVVSASLLSSTSDMSENSNTKEDESLGYSSGGSTQLNDLNEIKTGDTFITHFAKKDGLKSFSPVENGIALNPIHVPPSIFITSLEPRTISDKKVLDENLKILLREDPSLRVFENEEGQTLISGMGELHLEIIKDRLINDMRTNCDISKVMVTYKETLLKNSPVVSKTIKGNSNDPEDKFEIEFQIQSFDGAAEDHPLFEEIGESNGKDLILLPNDNNLAYIPPSAAPKSVQSYIEKHGTDRKSKDTGDDFWPLGVSYEQVTNAIVSSCVSTLQNGGPIANLPLHSILVKINKWSMPKASNDLKSLLFLTRDCINETLNGFDANKDFTILEPIMSIKVFADNEDLGKVTHDLTSSRKAEIYSIEDESDSIGGSEEDGVNNFIREAEKQYLPYDSTLDTTNMSNKDIGGKVVHATAPLREMIGYLTKLRSLTKGRGTFLMEYQGLNKVTRDRAEKILEDI